MPESDGVALDQLVSWAQDAERRARALVVDLNDDQLVGPYLPTVNPLRWEIGHAAWFYSRWVLRKGRGEAPGRSDEDSLFDSINIAHSPRWALPLPSLEDTLSYCRKVHDRVIADARSDDVYLLNYAVFHEDMHCEAFAITRQTLGYPSPEVRDAPRVTDSGGGHDGDAAVPGGTFPLGAPRDGAFAFDNEKWSHPVQVEPFNIARAPVTQVAYSEFVSDGGYTTRQLWSPAGWAWRQANDLQEPRFWRRSNNGFERRHYDTWVSLEPHRPVVHVSWYEAEAYCRWAGRRLPTELEWEVAAASQPDQHGGLSAIKRPYPWGDTHPTPSLAHFDIPGAGCVDVASFAEGDSAWGCRQMLGNVWEWTSSNFVAYPGFVADMYKEFSEPWFGALKVMRGGAHTTHSRLMNNNRRNFYTPNRNDVFAGFRTCAL